MWDLQLLGSEEHSLGTELAGEGRAPGAAAGGRLALHSQQEGFSSFQAFVPRAAGHHSPRRDVYFGSDKEEVLIISSVPKVLSIEGMKEITSPSLDLG